MASVDNSGCTFDTCPVESSWFGYRPSLVQNAVLLVIFTITFTIHSYFCYRYKTWGFGITFSVACFLEATGFAGRILAYTNPWSLPAFFIQINGIGLAPVVFAAGIYLCLTRIVILYGAHLSLVKPKVYTYFFIFCDFVSMTIQAPGGVLSAVYASRGEMPTLGANIGFAGLLFQVVAMTLWILLCAQFAWNCRRVGKKNWDPRYEAVRESWKCKAYLGALALAITTLYIRSVYRAVELRQGYTGHLARDETAFFILEGIMIVITATSVAIFHPGWGYGEVYLAITEQKRQYPRPWQKGGFWTEKNASEFVPMSHLDTERSAEASQSNSLYMK